MKIIEVVEKNCLDRDDESEAFFYKMIGDYYRYVAESAGNDDIFEKVKNGAQKGYEKAYSFS